MHCSVDQYTVLLMDVECRKGKGVRVKLLPTNLSLPLDTVCFFNMQNAVFKNSPAWCNVNNRFSHL